LISPGVIADDVLEVLVLELDELELDELDSDSDAVLEEDALEDDVASPRSSSLSEVDEDGGCRGSRGPAGGKKDGSGLALGERPPLSLSIFFRRCRSFLAPLRGVEPT